MASEADQIIGLYQRHAGEWDQARGRSLLEEAWLDRFSALLPHGGKIFDIGCGSGEPIARYLIGKGFALTGVDSAPAMIGMCQARFPDHNWIVADMCKLSIGQRFDGLLAWDSLFHLGPNDQRNMFPIFGKHAAASAALMFTNGPSCGEAIGMFHGEPLYHASLDADEYRSLLDEHGFKVVAHVAEDASCGGHTIWLAQRI